MNVGSSIPFSSLFLQRYPMYLYQNLFFWICAFPMQYTYLFLILAFCLLCLPAAVLNTLSACSVYTFSIQPISSTQKHLHSTGLIRHSMQLLSTSAFSLFLVQAIFIFSLFQTNHSKLTFYS